MTATSAGSSPQDRCAAMRARTPSANSSTSPGRDCFGTGPSAPAGMWWTRSPGSTATMAAASALSARVYTSHATPARARPAESSRT